MIDRRWAGSPVGPQLAGDAQHVDHALRLQLSAADGGGDEAARPANPGAAGRQAGRQGSIVGNVVIRHENHAMLLLSLQF